MITYEEFKNYINEEYGWMSPVVGGRWFDPQNGTADMFIVITCFGSFTMEFSGEEIYRCLDGGGFDNLKKLTCARMSCLACNVADVIKRKSGVMAY